MVLDEMSCTHYRYPIGYTWVGGLGPCRAGGGGGGGGGGALEFKI